MNNEDKILEILLQMQGDISKLKVGQAKLEAGQANLEAGLSGVKADVSDLRTEMNDRFNSLEFRLNETLKDLGHAEDRLDLHEDIIQKKIM